MKNKKNIYTNGHSLFTLEDYGKTAGVCNANGIVLHSEVSIIKARAMHSKGHLYYVNGCGDSKELKAVKLFRGMKTKSFQIN